MLRWKAPQPFTVVPTFRSGCFVSVPVPVVVGGLPFAGCRPVMAHKMDESPSMGFDIEYSDDGVSWVTAKSVASEVSLGLW